MIKTHIILRFQAKFYYFDTELIEEIIIKEKKTFKIFGIISRR